MFLLWEGSNTDTDCPEMLYHVHPWGYSKPDRMQSWAGCCEWELGGMISRGARQPQLHWDSAGWCGCAAQICLLVQNACCEGTVPNEMAEQRDPTGCPACTRLMDCIRYWREDPNSAPTAADTTPWPAFVPSVCPCATLNFSSVHQFAEMDAKSNTLTLLAVQFEMDEWKMLCKCWVLLLLGEVKKSRVGLGIHWHSLGVLNTWKKLPLSLVFITLLAYVVWLFS